MVYLRRAQNLQLKEEESGEKN
jgi:hypothetical protein